MTEVGREGMGSVRVLGESIKTPLDRADERAHSCVWFARRAAFFAHSLALGLSGVFLLLHPTLSLASTFTVFGETFQRATGAPVTMTRSFSVPNSPTTYNLRIDNGGLPGSQL